MILWFLYLCIVGVYCIATVLENEKSWSSWRGVSQASPEITLYLRSLGRSYKQSWDTMGLCSLRYAAQLREKWKTSCCGHIPEAEVSAVSPSRAIRFPLQRKALKKPLCNLPVRSDFSEVESSTAPDPETSKLQREGKSRKEGSSEGFLSGQQRLRASQKHTMKKETHGCWAKYARCCMQLFKVLYTFKSSAREAEADDFCEFQVTQGCFSVLSEKQNTSKTKTTTKILWAVQTSPGSWPVKCHLASLVSLPSRDSSLQS